MEKLKNFLHEYSLAIISGLLIGTSYIPFPPWAIFFCFVPLWIYWLKTKSLKKTNFGENLNNEELLELDVDALIPAALDGVINEKNAKRIKAKIIIEGANGPVTPEASKILYKNNTIVVPDILANGGGVIVSYFEWVQGIASFFWEEEEVNRRLKYVITKAFADVVSMSKKEDFNMKTAALAIAIKRVENAMLLRGLYPR